MPRGGKREGAGRPQGARAKALLRLEGVREETADYCGSATIAMLKELERRFFLKDTATRDCNVMMRLFMEYSQGRPLQQQEITMTGAPLEIRFLDAPEGSE